MKFALPVLAALFLQSLYGAMDLLLAGQFVSSADVSAVSTGSMLLQTVTNAIAGLSMGASIMFFIVFGIVLSVSLFRIDCSTPCATSVETLIFPVYFFHIRKRLRYDEEKRQWK